MSAGPDKWSRALVEAGAAWSDLAGLSIREIRHRADRLDVDRSRVEYVLDAGGGARRAGVLAFDTETWRIAPGRLAPPMVCASFAWRGPDEKIRSILTDKATGLEVLRVLLTEPSTCPTIVAHNASFDNAVLIANACDLEHVVWQALDADLLACTEIRERLLCVARGEANRHDPPASLAACVKRYFSETVAGKGADAWRLRYHELDGVPLNQWPDEAVRYAEHDARYCLRVYEAQNAEIDRMTGTPTIPDEAPQTRGAWGLHLTSAWGFRCDEREVEAYEAELDARVDVAEAQLADAEILVDGTVKKAVTQDYVLDAYARHGLGEAELTKKGQGLRDDKEAPQAYEDLVPQYVSAAGDVLREVPCSGEPCDPKLGYVCDELLHVLADRQDAALERTRYVKHLRRGVVEVLNPRISPVKATGRCSVSKPPYQQFPRRPGARECVVPRPGRVFIGADYSAAELVTLAQVLVESIGYSALAEVLREGLDPHLRTGADILGIEYAVALERLRGGDKEVKDARQLAKALNFGLPGGLGPKTFVDYAWSSWGLRITEQRARSLKQRWLAIYPEVREYFSLISKRLDEAGGSFDLRHSGSGFLRGGVGYCDGCNSNFQEKAAAAAKAALYRVQRECWTGEDYSRSGALFGVRPVLFVHDEIIAEADEDRAADAAERLAVVMVEELAARCPDVAEAAKAEPWIARRWSKSIEPVRDDRGRLQVWDG